MKLTGIRVLDLSSFIPGPYLTLALADHGAEVIKVEAPGGGDPYRHVGLRQGAHSALFTAFNRGKKSVVVDLKDPDDRDRFLEMAETADVIVESNRPGVARRLGIDYDAVAERNPGIVYCSVSGFGQDGPNADRPAHALALEAESGFLSMNVDAANRPVIPAIPVPDITAGLHGLSAVLMALLARDRHGRGDHIDISMQDSLIATMLNILPQALVRDEQPVAREERTTGGAAFYSIYDTRDGRQVAIAGQEPKFLRALLSRLDRMDLMELCERGPGPHQAPVFELLSDLFGNMTLKEVTEFLGPLDLCWGICKTMPEALEDPHLLARNTVLMDESGARHIATPIRFRNEPAQYDLKPPAYPET